MGPKIKSWGHLLNFCLTAHIISYFALLLTIREVGLHKFCSIFVRPQDDNLYKRKSCGKQSKALGKSIKIAAIYSLLSKAYFQKS